MEGTWFRSFGSVGLGFLWLALFYIWKTVLTQGHLNIKEYQWIQPGRQSISLEIPGHVDERPMPINKHSNNKKSLVEKDRVYFFFYLTMVIKRSILISLK